MGTESPSLCMGELAFISLFSQLLSWLIVRSEKPFRMSNSTSKPPGCSQPSTCRKNSQWGLFFCFVLFHYRDQKYLTSPTPNMYFITCQRKRDSITIPNPGIRVFLPHLPPRDHISIPSLARSTCTTPCLIPSFICDYSCIGTKPQIPELLPNSYTGSGSGFCSSRSKLRKKKSSSSSKKNHICCILKIYPFH